MYKLVIPLLILLSIGVFIFYQPPKKTISPNSLSNQIEQQLYKSIKDKNLTITELDIDLYNQKISFKLVDNGRVSTVILSSQKDISLQINALQKLYKTVKIDLAYPALIDLSLDKPYATIENNKRY